MAHRLGGEKPESSLKGDNEDGDDTTPVKDLSSPCQAVHRRKQLNSSYIFGSFIAMGMMVALHGPTFLDLLLIVNVSFERGTLIFTSRAVGFLLGNLTGGLLYDKCNKELLLFIVTLVIGVTTAVLPWSRYLPVMAVVSFVRAGAKGGLNAGGNAMMIGIWGKDIGPYIQALHFAFSAGGIVSPLIAQPFLFSRLDMPSNETLDAWYDTENATYYSDVQLGSAKYNSSAPSRKRWNFEAHNATQNFTNIKMDLPNEQTNVYIPYAIVGLVSVLASFPFIEMHLNKKSERRSQSDIRSNAEIRKDSSHMPLTPLLKVTFLVMMGAFYVSSACVEETFTSLMMTFVVVHLAWSKTKGTQITTVVWIAYSFGRLVAIFLSKYLSPWKMLLMDIVLLSTSFLALSFTAEESEVCLWLFAVLIAIAMASVVPTGMAWMESSILQMTGKVTSFLLVCESAGGMTGPILVGYLFENHTPMWFVYLLFIQTLVCGVWFTVISLLLTWLRRQRKSETSRMNGEQQTKL